VTCLENLANRFSEDPYGRLPTHFAIVGRPFDKLVETRLFDQMLFRKSDHDKRLRVHYPGTWPNVGTFQFLQRASLRNFASREGVKLVQHITSFPDFRATASWNVFSVIVTAGGNTLDILNIMMIIKGLDVDQAPRGDTVLLMNPFSRGYYDLLDWVLER
jgi:hypothetical protein